LKAQGINAASITYDAREVLSAFSSAYKIEYPMLSDVGSKVIRAFGILNTNIPPDHAFYGVPWPGEYLVAPDGTVRDKVFLPSYEHRASATEVIFRNCGVDNTGHGVEIKTTVVDASVTLSSDRCFAGQELGIALDLNVKPGWHLYGKPLPSNYRPTELVLSGPLVDHLTLELPAPQTKLMKALDETLPIYEGKVRAVRKLAIKWSPPIPAPFLLKIGPAIEAGAHKIAGVLRYQACSETVCEAPEEISFELPLTIEKGVPSAPKPG
jgi:hypothetical protein